MLKDIESYKSLLVEPKYQVRLAQIKREVPYTLMKDDFEVYQEELVTSLEKYEAAKPCPHLHLFIF